MVFADRVEVWNPGELPPPLTPDRLRQPHSSIARNHRICEALFLTRYIEKFGTGTLMMIRESAANGLPEPQFEQRAGEFVAIIWRDWLTQAVINRLPLNERQRRAITHIKIHRRITNSEFQNLFGVAKRTASLDLAALVAAGVIEKSGSTGKGVFYSLAKGAPKGQKGQSLPNAKGHQRGNTGTDAGTATRPRSEKPDKPTASRPTRKPPRRK